MDKQHRIDCHTHIVNRQIKDAYYQNAAGEYAVIMEFLPQFTREGCRTSPGSWRRGMNGFFVPPALISIKGFRLSWRR